MKYNVKQAVSGIQGEMDKAASNQVLGKALSGLASGVGGAIQSKQNRQQYDRLMGEKGPVAAQRNYFKQLAETGDKDEKLFANDALLKLGVWEAGLTPANIGGANKSYKDVVTGGSLFDPLYGIRRAQIQADAYARRPNPLEEIKSLLQPKPVPGVSSVDNSFVDLAKEYGTGVLNYFGGGAPGMQPSSLFSESDFGI